ncbi:hypothetical protein ACF068_30510 [Streptomyces sp. NPDC016309]|uniref:hypothetical protein n=1 Tax=Streptomyces sp. NPDC016309 TaxID=3364965 RepID=UPI0036FFA6C1
MNDSIPQKIITYLEMTDPADLNPAPAVPGLALRRLDTDSPLVRSVQARVGENYGWRAAARTEEQWEERGLPGVHGAHPSERAGRKADLLIHRITVLVAPAHITLARGRSPHPDRSRKRGVRSRWQRRGT